MARVRKPHLVRYKPHVAKATATNEKYTKMVCTNNICPKNGISDSNGRLIGFTGMRLFIVSRFGTSTRKLMNDVTPSAKKLMAKPTITWSTL